MADKDLDGSYNCCCAHITTCGKIIAGIGIVGAIITLIASIFSWFYIPSSIMSFIVYSLVFYGIQKSRPGFLLPAKIILAIGIIINTLIVIALFVLGIVLPSTVTCTGNVYYCYTLVQEARRIIQTTFFVTAALLLLAMSYTVFSFIVISRARKYLLQHVKVLPPPSPMYPQACNK